MPDDRFQIRFGQFLAGYFASMIGVVGLALLLERLYHVEGIRTIFVGGGVLFLVASTGRPWFWYQVIRNTGWFGHIRNGTVMRTLLAVLGLLLVVVGMVARFSR
jgi:hypothetical protein